MTTINIVYSGLLADVADSTGFSEIRGSWISDDWVAREAPRLDKLLLGYLEGRENELSGFPQDWSRLVQCAREGSIVHVRYLRQLLQFGYKAEVTPTSEQLSQADSKYVQTDKLVGEWWAAPKNVVYRKLVDRVRVHVQSVLHMFNSERIIPGHGPGASTTPKDDWGSIPDTVSAVFASHDLYQLNRGYGHKPLAYNYEPTWAKLTAVPKDSRGPRLICVHPAPLMWCQQGVRRELERCISLTRPRRQGIVWPKGYINFDDQTVNGGIALASSSSQEDSFAVDIAPRAGYATIDLSEASDRLADGLVQYLFGAKYKYFGCCRAPLIKLLSGQTHWLNAYAPMGNATVFPVQSLVFWSICVAAMEYEGVKNPSVFVFGDDIEPPNEHCAVCIEALESFGLKVNVGKTFVRGLFRESCGVDAFRGVDITPLRYKTSSTLNSLESLQSASDLAMRLRMAGYLRAAACLYDEVRRVFRFRYGKDLGITPNPNHGGIAEYSEDYPRWRKRVRLNRDLQLAGTYIHRLEERPAKGIARGWNPVLESITKQMAVGGGRVEIRDGARRRLCLKRRWMAL